MNAGDPQSERPGSGLLADQRVSLITLSELKALGGFVRHQDIEALLVGAAPRLTAGYPLFVTRLRREKQLDMLVNDKWETVDFVGLDGTQIRYRRGSRQEARPLDDPWARDRRVGTYCIAPAGVYTAYTFDTPAIQTVTLSNAYRRSSGSFATRCELVSVSEPYVTLRIEYADGRGSSGWDFETFHVADPRICVAGVVPREPFYNSPIAVSHRWLSETHPDPDGVHFRALLAWCERMRLLDCQTFFIDYCSLPQPPRTADEEDVFRFWLPEANRHYQRSTVVLTEETDDYETRAWCMFEMILASVRNVVLNEDATRGKLQCAFDLARSFVEASVANRGAMKAFGIMPGGKISREQLHQWSRGSLGLNRAYFAMQHQRRGDILRWFQNHGLKASNSDDIPLIVDLLDRLL